MAAHSPKTVGQPPDPGDGNKAEIDALALTGDPTEPLQKTRRHKQRRSKKKPEPLDTAALDVPGPPLIMDASANEVVAEANGVGLITAPNGYKDPFLPQRESKGIRRHCEGRPSTHIDCAYCRHRSHRKPLEV